MVTQLPYNCLVVPDGPQINSRILREYNAPMFWSSSIFQGSLHCTPDSFMLSWMSCALKHQCANLHGIFSVSRALPHLLKVSVQCPLVAGLPDSPFRCGRVPVAWCNNLVCIGEVQHALFGSFFLFSYSPPSHAVTCLRLPKINLLIRCLWKLTQGLTLNRNI